jgi:hypothetical protein
LDFEIFVATIIVDGNSQICFHKSMLTEPANFLRQFSLASEDGGIAWDKTYRLVFTTDGRMFVRVVKDFEQPYKTPDIDEIYPPEFPKIIVNGTPLNQLVARKLQEILPPQINM